METLSEKRIAGKTIIKNVKPASKSKNRKPDVEENMAIEQFANRRNRTFSKTKSLKHDEVWFPISAADMDIESYSEAGLQGLSEEAKRSIDRSLNRMDETHVFVTEMLKKIDKRSSGRKLKIRFADVKELHRNAYSIIGFVEKRQYVVITKRGKPAALICPLDEDFIEDYIIQHSPTIRKKIEQGLKDQKAGRVTPIENLLKVRKARKRTYIKTSQVPLL